ncbi:MAG: hypothetical protein QW818_01580 [Candidatus Aenigmatarchaeota archaeon]|nr:hypothetical protein [Candidatus Aenigmarchaeota archaeon]
MVVKLKGKQWFTILAPKYFGEKEIGKTLSSTPENLIGKTLSISAVDLTNDINKYYIKLKFRIISVDSDKAFTQFYGSECLQDYIARMVLRRIKRLDSIQDLTTRDNVKIRVKSLIIVPKKAKSSVASKIRNFVMSITKKEVEESTLEEFLYKMLSNEIKNKILKEGRKIYPIRNFEIRRTEIIQ